MPELPDVVVYCESIAKRVLGHTLQKIRLQSPFLLRSVQPPLEDAHGKVVRDVRRIGKRIVLGLEPDYFLVLHLMIAGRLHWSDPPDVAEGRTASRGRYGSKKSATPFGKNALVAFEFDNGTLTLTEAGTKKRASLYFVYGEGALLWHNPGGIEPLTSTFEEFKNALQRENHTIKRTLTDPKIISGIGNAYSDEILHRAKLSPFLMTRKMTDEQLRASFEAMRSLLTEWIEQLRKEAEKGFPENVTAFRPDFAVHGRFEKPCPVCRCPVQRIVYSENETNYCPRCQTGGKLLADRSLSRLLKDDWPKTIDD